MKVLRYNVTAQKCGVSPITIRRWATLPEYADKGFPKPVVLGANSVGFIEAEVDSWLSARAAEHDASGEAA